MEVSLLAFSQERFFLGVVGANEWRGGYQDIPLSTMTPRFKRVHQITPDSYLGERLPIVASTANTCYVFMSGICMVD